MTGATDLAVGAHGPPARRQPKCCPCICVRRVVDVVDCGFVVNTDTAIARVERCDRVRPDRGSQGRNHNRGGHATQRGSRDYPLLTIAEMPGVEVDFIPNREPPTEVGKCGMPRSHLLSNAVFAATGIAYARCPSVLGLKASMPRPGVDVRLSNPQETNQL
jgi:hypothetical protein